MDQTPPKQVDTPTEETVQSADFAQPHKLLFSKLSRKKLIVVLVFVLLVGTVFLVLKRGSISDKIDNDTMKLSGSFYGITLSDNCFSPKELTIKKGETVKFTNRSSRDMWPAAGEHPSHASSNGFDAGKSIPPGGSYSFTFEKSGTWDFHDHSSANCGGVITVR